ncbi:hypothetical protein G6F56_010382 [Rhizopus delemar]|nr:hypothetical protein G6F56_010382 [Rhizopus delemar]
MKGKQKDTSGFSSSKKEPPTRKQDLYEMYAEDNSDNDFQPTILYKKRTSRENTRQNESRKRLKGKQKEKTQESTLDYTISFDDYDLEFGSENFEDPNSTFDTTGSSTNTFERATTASTIPSIFIPNAFKSNAASTKPSSHPAPAENVNNRAPNNSSKHVITVKTTIKKYLEDKLSSAVV